MKLSIARRAALMCLAVLALGGCWLPAQAPEKLAFYYGWPSLVNGANGDTALAAQTFEDYDVVVFGNGLDDPAHGDHERTRTIIGAVSGGGTRVYGYVDLCWQGGSFCSSLSMEQMRASIDRWAAMGVAGIFLDQAGYDYTVSRERLNQTVDYIHAKGLSAFVNPWDPDDVFSPDAHPTLNPAGVATRLGPDDYCLHESFAVSLSAYQAPTALIAKSEKGLKWKRLYGTRMATVNTVALHNPPFDATQFEYVWWMTLLYDFDAMAWGETAFFSSETNALPFHARPAPGDIGVDVQPIEVTHHGAVHRRATTTGTVEVNTVAHAGRFIAGTPPPPNNGVAQPGTQPTDLIGGDADFAPEHVALTLRSNGAPISGYRFFIDRDASSASGFQHSGNAGVGSEYLIENGNLYRFTGATQGEWSWAFMVPLSAAGAGTAELVVTLPLSAIDYTAGGDLALLGEHFDAATFGSHDLLLRAPGVWIVAPE